MKKIFTLIIILSASISSFAFSNRLTISSSNDNDKLYVAVDGRNYKSSNRLDDAFLIDDLKAGYHSIKIYRTANGRGFGNVSNLNNMKLLYSGNVYVRNGYHTDIVINRFGKAFTDERQINRYDEDEDNNYNGYDDNYNQPMNERSFEQLKQSIRRENFDDTKLNIAKVAIRNQAVNTLQVKELLGLFSFEQNKLDLAKYCYQYTTDFNNYYSVANSFGFSSSKAELLRYIEQNRRQ